MIKLKRKIVKIFALILISMAVYAGWKVSMWLFLHLIFMYYNWRALHYLNFWNFKMPPNNFFRNDTSKIHIWPIQARPILPTKNKALTYQKDSNICKINTIPFPNFYQCIFPPKISASRSYHYKLNYVKKWIFALILPNKNVWSHLIDILTTEGKLGLKTNQQNTTPKLTMPKKLITVGASSQTDGKMGSRNCKNGSPSITSLPLLEVFAVPSITSSTIPVVTCPFTPFFCLCDICNAQKYCSTLSYFPELFEQPLLFLECRTPCQSFLNPEDDGHGTQASF